MKTGCTLMMCLFICTLSCSFETHEKDAISYSVTLEKVTDALQAPIGMAAPQDGSGRLFVIEQQGTVRIIKNGQLLQKPFLDISGKMDNIGDGYSEKGLLGIAFHPKYVSNGFFYIYYSATSVTKGMNHKSRIAAYHVSANPDVAANDEKVLLEIEEPESNHNGGQLCFGPDGYLYIGTGDGGGAGDKHGTSGNGQNLNTLLGKILRIDVNAEGTYTIPSDNPFVNKEGLDEIYAYGLRNPWRFSFDRQQGTLFCADVGQNEYEEVDIIEKGRNYGWRIMEGNHCYNPSKNCTTTGLALPIAEYGHSEGKSIIGGYVYRGTKAEEMLGNYIFGDWTGKIFMLLKSTASNQWERRTLNVKGVDGGFYINSFGEGADGTLYVLGQQTIGTSKKGVLYKMVFE